MPQAPDEVQVEFGLDLHAEVGAFIAAANFKTTITWRRTQAIVHPRLIGFRSQRPSAK
jgi:hypothetical protein